jgi:hypothetical protein
MRPSQIGTDFAKGNDAFRISVVLGKIRRTWGNGMSDAGEVGEVGKRRSKDGRLK